DSGIDTENIRRRNRSFVLDRDLANGGTETVAMKEVNSGNVCDGVNPCSMEQRRQGGLVQVAERVTIVRVNRQLDRREGRNAAGSAVERGTAKVCQKTTRCTWPAARCSRKANALAPYVGSRTRPCRSANRAAASPSTVG